MSRPAARSPRAIEMAEPAGLATRRIAAEILDRVESQRAFADVLLGHRIVPLEPADRRLVTLLVLGTLAWQGRLDYELRHLSSRPLEEIDPAVMILLRMGLFQLRHTDRIPAHAAVSTAVEIARQSSRTRKASGLVNAILRKAARGKIAMPARDRDPIEFLAVSLSHPRWLVESFIEWFGVAEAESLMAANNEAAPNVIRLNLSQMDRAEVIARLETMGIRLEPAGVLDETAIVAAALSDRATLTEAGLGCWQSEASQWVARMVAPARGARVVDCSAAPGGKATHLAELAGLDGRVIALDINLSGLKRARTLATALGHPNIDFVRADMTAAPSLRTAAFDAVLLDAPCSGLGTIREHPEIRWRLQPADLIRLANLQSRMIDQAAMLVRPGGAIVYSVCSVAPAEGRDIVNGFLTRNGDFSLDPQPPVPTALARHLAPDGTLSTRPDLGGRDGFFAARLIRRFAD